MTAPIRAVPWLLAVIGLAVPLVGGDGAGWVYVMGWLVVLAAIRLLRPLGQADRRERIVAPAVVAVALVAPGIVVGGFYLVPAALAWLVIEVRSAGSSVSIVESTDRWHWSEDVFEPVDFCVHALLCDGLHVAPFDQHAEGDGTLRQRGLDSEAWRAWLAAVIAQHGLLSVLATAPAIGRDQSEARARAAEAWDVLRSPGSFCPGTPELRARLDEVWADYEPAGVAWKRTMTMGERGVRHRLAPRHQRWLWQALKRFHERLPTLFVFVVDYPVPVVMTVPPAVAVIASDPSDRDGSAYARQVLAAAEQLSSRPDGQHQRS